MPPSRPASVAMAPAAAAGKRQPPQPHTAHRAWQQSVHKEQRILTSKYMRSLGRLPGVEESEALVLDADLPDRGLQSRSSSCGRIDTANSARACLPPISSLAHLGGAPGGDPCRGLSSSRAQSAGACVGGDNLLFFDNGQRRPSRLSTGRSRASTPLTS